MTKHFPGGGPQADGEDPHFPYGKDQVYPGRQLRGPPAALRGGVRRRDGADHAVLRPAGRDAELEAVGFGFNRDVITGLLRGRYGFDGVVCTDWALVTDCRCPTARCGGRRAGASRTLEQRRAAREDRRGRLRPARRRDAARSCSSSSSATGGSPKSGSTSRRAGCCATSSGSGCSTIRTSTPTPPSSSAAAPSSGRRATGRSAGRWCCSANDGRPAARGRPASLRRRGRARGRRCATARWSSEPEDADVAIVRRNAPFEPRSGGFIETQFHAGDLDFKEPELGELLALARQRPDDPRPAPRAAGGHPGARRGVRGGRRHVRRLRRGRPRRPLRPGRARGPAAVRAAVVDGRRARAEAGRAVRLGGSALPVRARARVQLGGLAHFPTVFRYRQTASTLNTAAMPRDQSDGPPDRVAGGGRR